MGTSICPHVLVGSGVPYVTDAAQDAGAAAGLFLGFRHAAWLGAVVWYGMM